MKKIKQLLEEAMYIRLLPRFPPLPILLGAIVLACLLAYLTGGKASATYGDEGYGDHSVSMSADAEPEFNMDPAQAQAIEVGIKDIVTATGQVSYKPETRVISVTSADGANENILRMLTEAANNPGLRYEYEVEYKSKPVVLNAEEDECGWFCTMSDKNYGDVTIRLEKADGEVHFYHEGPDGSVEEFVPGGFMKKQNAYAVSYRFLMRLQYGNSYASVDVHLNGSDDGYSIDVPLGGGTYLSYGVIAGLSEDLNICGGGNGLVLPLSVMFGRDNFWSSDTWNFKKVGEIPYSTVMWNYRAEQMAA